MSKKKKERDRRERGKDTLTLLDGVEGSSGVFGDVGDGEGAALALCEL